MIISQEALVREQMLENKLSVLQRLVGQTESASSDAWKSLIDEDRLLTRVEILVSTRTLDKIDRRLKKQNMKILGKPTFNLCKRCFRGQA